MSPERQPLDLAEVAKNHLIEVEYNLDEECEPEPTLNFLPLETAKDIDLARIVNTKDQNFYVVTPASIATSQDKEVAVSLVYTVGFKELVEKELTSYEFSNCTSCGGPLNEKDNKKILKEKINCSYCNTVNEGVANPEKVQVKRFRIEEIMEERSRMGTVQELIKENETIQKERSSPLYRIKKLFRSDSSVPLEAIEEGKKLVSEDQEMVISGPFSKGDEKQLFLYIEETQKAKIEEKKEGEEILVESEQNELYPEIPGSYVLNEIEDISDRGDYLLKIESDSGEQLPLVVMTDKDGKPSRFVVPLRGLMKDGWTIQKIGSVNSLNEVIKNNNLQRREGPNSADSIVYGKVKIFWWNNDSERHDAITDALDEEDFDYTISNVSADIPDADLSKLEIEHSG